MFSTKSYADLSLKTQYQEKKVQKYILNNLNENGDPKNVDGVLIQHIGQGTYGDVYFYKYEGLEFVLKISRKSTLAVKRTANNERKLLQVLSDFVEEKKLGYTAWCIDHWESNGRVYIVLQKALGDMLQFPYNQTKKQEDVHLVFTQILYSLYLFHETTGKIHNDVSLENFFYFNSTVKGNFNRTLPYGYDINIPECNFEIVLYDPGLAAHCGNGGKWFCNDYQMLFEKMNNAFGNLLKKEVKDVENTLVYINLIKPGLALTKTFNYSMTSEQCLGKCLEFLKSYTVSPIQYKKEDLDFGEVASILDDKFTPGTFS